MSYKEAWYAICTSIKLHCVWEHHWLSGLDEDDECNDNWGPLILMGISALNATVGLTKSMADPFSPTEVPLISVLPPTPDNTPRNSHFQWDDSDLMTPSSLSDITSQVSPLTYILIMFYCVKFTWIDTRSGTWNVRSLYRAGSLLTACGSVWVQNLVSDIKGEI
jgi:hypothetical protein